MLKKNLQGNLLEQLDMRSRKIDGMTPSKPSLAAFRRAGTARGRFFFPASAGGASMGGGVAWAAMMCAAPPTRV